LVSFNKVFEKVDLPLIMIAWARSMQVAFLISFNLLCLAKKKLRLRPTILQHPRTNEWLPIPVTISQIHGLQAFVSNNLRRRFVVRTGTSGHIKTKNFMQRRKLLFLRSLVRKPK
jgi:hypothetical protein